MDDIETVLTALSVPAGVCDSNGDWIALSRALGEYMHADGCDSLRKLMNDDAEWEPAWQAITSNRRHELADCSLAHPLTDFLACSTQIELVGIGSPVYLVEFRLKPKAMQPYPHIARAYRTSAQFRNDQHQANRRIAQAVDESFIDTLTSTQNRRAYDLYAGKRWKRAIRERAYLSLLMIDIDHFKLVNDQLGHASGDKILQQIASCLVKAVTRRSDFVGRIGGEEFAVLLPNTEAEGAKIVADKIQNCVHGLALPHPGGSVAPFVTVSVGGITAKPSPRASFEDFSKAADKAMYEAKSTGRNRTVMRTEICVQKTHE